MACTSIVALALLVGASPGGPSGTPPTAQEASATPAQRLAALIERYKKQQSEVFQAYSKAEEAAGGAGLSTEESTRILAALPGREYIPEFRAVAEEAKGTDTAVQAWMWVLRLIEGGTGSAASKMEQGWEVIELLLEQHIQSPALAELAGRLRGEDYGERFVVEALRTLVADSPHDKVRASALLTLGKVLLASSSAEARAEGRDCLQAVIEEYGALANGGRTFKADAEGHLYELDNLQIGMRAPDFASTDENGVPWKLSDYRGKVVVVDFWGFW